jgi:chemotaxis protein methyltransferase CheR
MTLLESPAADLGWHFEVLATDVSNRALDVARAGVYPARALATMPPALLARYFEPHGDDFRVSEPVRSIVQFRYHNLIREPFPPSMGGEWDVVFCRNVTIYFKLESTRRIVAEFGRILRPGGYLFIGHSESLTTISDRYETVERDGVYVYRTPTPPGRRPGAGRDFPVGAPGDEPDARGATVHDLAPARARFERDSALRSAGAASAFDLDGPATDAGTRAASARHEAVLAAEQAESALAAGDTGSAHAAARRIAQVDPSGSDAPMLDAQAYADDGDWDAAADACRRALSANPLLPAARYLLGIVEMRRGDLTAAERELRRTVYVDPGFALAHLNLGNLYQSQERWAEAAGAYQAAVAAIHGEGSDAWMAYLGGFDVDTLERTARRGLEESRKAAGGV